ncbi:hypothetical protein QJS10_CPA03g02426 [Acorus calamus]|uniref:AAA+ ATPase domain-containing protein n=1 Tax=Acorus calamus TaxID=4465 RepID=A0AAV9F2E1_ACOCL|nr:hypothetical protein QJS10_CPA03g02426 [Acorus calamus]
MASAPGKCFLVTGPPGVGKTTLVMRVLEKLMNSNPCLNVKDDTDLFIIDEVGKMELFSSTFYPAVLEIIGSNIPILASIPIPKFGHDIPAVARLRNHPGATVFTLSKSNRDAIEEEIYSQLVGLLRKE